MVSPLVTAPELATGAPVASRARSRTVDAAVTAALGQAGRLRRPVAVTTTLFTVAAVFVLIGGAAAGAGILAGLGVRGGAGPAVVLIAAALYAVPLFLLMSCRNALASYPRFLDILEQQSRCRVPATAGPPPQRNRRATVRVLHATRRLLRSASVPVKASAQAAGMWRLTSPVLSAGGAIAFVATPALFVFGLAILAAGVVLA